MVEPLESRTILAASIVEINGVPAIIGTRRRDEIEVLITADLTGGYVRANVNGQRLDLCPFACGSDLPWAIRIHGRGGNDSIQVLAGSFVGQLAVVGGGPGDDHIEILGAQVRAAVAGGTGNDYIHGYGALAGGVGNDTLEGTTEDDTLRGGPGDDRLVSWGGDDRLIGGTGNDQIIPGEPDAATYAQDTQGNSTNALLRRDPSPLFD
jgi:Ca2+-binding RTX toxin-like protein